jgi:hypothetical protein
LVEVSVPIPNQTAELSQIKNDLLARGVIPQNPADNRTAFEIVSRLAWALRGQGAKLIRKNPGQNGYTVESGPHAGERYSHDALSFPDGWVDCIANAGPPSNENRPSWGWTNAVRDPNAPNLGDPFDPDAGAAVVTHPPDPQSEVTPTQNQPGPVASGDAAALAQIAALLSDMRAAQEADHALQLKIVDTLEGLRRDVNNAGKTLGAVVAGGGLGSIADLFKR